MNRILKYTLPMKEESTIEMPYGAQIIKGENQEGFVQIWAIADDAAPMVKRHFRLYKTGQEIKVRPSDLFFIGRAYISVGMDLGMYIFEYFGNE